MIQPDPVTPRFSPWFKHWSKIGGILVIVLFGMAFFGFAMARMRHQWHQEPALGQPTTLPAPLPGRVGP